MLETIAFVYNVLATNVASSQAKSAVLATHEISLENRYNNSFVNGVFRDNILLTINYMDGRIKSKQDINWDNVAKPFHSEFVLKPNEVFAFHDLALPEYKNIVKTTNAHFNYSDGFKSDGYLMGDGVCHLASLIYWAAKDAGLSAVSPRNHDFAMIPDVPKQYGVAIYYPSKEQNLYITNNYNYPIVFAFNYDGINLKISVHNIN